MRSTPVVSSTDHGCESPAVVRPLAFGPVGFFLPGLAGLESLTKRMEAAAAQGKRGLMSFLYVCLFSNGHLKVGRSVNALARTQ